MSHSDTPASAMSPRNNATSSRLPVILLILGIGGLFVWFIAYPLYKAIAPESLDPRLETLSENSRIPISERALSLSPDGRVLAYGTDTTGKILLNFETDERISLRHCWTVAWLTNDVIACYNGLGDNRTPLLPQLYHYPDMEELPVSTTLDTVPDTTLAVYKHDDMSDTNVFVAQNGQWYWVPQTHPLLANISVTDRTLPLAAGTVHPSPTGAYRLETDPRRAHYTQDWDVFRVVNTGTNEVYYERPYGRLLVPIGWTYDGCGMLFADFETSLFAGWQQGYVYKLNVPCAAS